MAKLTTIGIALAILMGSGAALGAANLGDDGHRDRHAWRDSPQFAQMHEEMCKDLYAREVGRAAYLEARLQLTASQSPLFQTWKNIVLANADERSKSCAAMTPPTTRPSVVEMMQYEQTRLEARLAALQAEMPALTALYQSLTPEQQKAFAFDGPGGRGRHGHFEHHGMDGHGPDDHGPDGKPDGA